MENGEVHALRWLQPLQRWGLDQNIWIKCGSDASPHVAAQATIRTSFIIEWVNMCRLRLPPIFFSFLRKWVNFMAQLDSCSSPWMTGDPIKYAWMRFVRQCNKGGMRGNIFLAMCCYVSDKWLRDACFILFVFSISKHKLKQCNVAFNWTWAAETTLLGGRPPAV